MKKIAALLIVSFVLIDATELKSLINKLNRSDILKSKEYEVLAKESLYRSKKGLNYPKIDLKLTFINLKETPKMAINMPPMPKMWAEVGDRKNFIGEVTLRYPIFRGFAISNLIKKAKIEAQVERLKRLDLKRDLTLKLTTLYAKLYSLKSLKRAVIEAKKAIYSSLKKAEGFYNQGLIDKSELLNIKANFYKIKADLKEVEANIKIVNSDIKYLTKSYAKASHLPKIRLNRSLNVSKRADILALKNMLFVDKTDINIAKSKFYPEVNLEASYKKIGNSLSLNGDGFRNANQSYVAVEMKYNLFNGFSDKENLEATKAKYLARKIYLKDYIKRAKKDIKNELIRLNALNERLRWAKEEFRAANEYQRLSIAKFNEQLISSDELSRAIASRAQAKATLQDIKAQIFIQKAKINLMHSNKLF